MKLLRLKITGLHDNENGYTNATGFRSLQPGFEHHFRTPWDLDEERAKEGDEQDFAPFVCAGRNGSGKSNLLEALSAIFYQLEVQRIRRYFLPDCFFNEDQNKSNDFQFESEKPESFELEYLIEVPMEYSKNNTKQLAHVGITKAKKQKKTKDGKQTDEIITTIDWVNKDLFETDQKEGISDRERDLLLPDFVIGYSSGENEVLSLPFFKMRFIQYDEYWNALTKQLPYPGRPESRLIYMDNSFSQAILLCNLLFLPEDLLKPFREDIGIESLLEFQIIIKRSIEITPEIVRLLGIDSQSLFKEDVPVQNTYDITRLLEKSNESESRFDPIITRLKRCATSCFCDEETDTLYLDYYVNEETKKAFKNNFDQSPVALFQALQVLLALNLYSVSEDLKLELYKSDSLYVSETVPTLASDQRIMRIKNFWIKKTDIDEPVLLKSLSDGEHQFLHSLGICLLLRDENCLFLLDEPETHFNPDWRSQFISSLNECFKDSKGSREMLITTHSPFLISDSKSKKVLEFEKKGNKVKVKNPDYKTLGASINAITMNTFNKEETIGGVAEKLIEDYRERLKNEDKQSILDEIKKTLGDSVEKVLLVKSIIDDLKG